VEIVSLQMDAIAVKAKRKDLLSKLFCRPSLHCGSITMLFAVSQLSIHCQVVVKSLSSRCQFITNELENKKLSAKENKMVGIAKEIEGANEHIREENIVRRCFSLH
jgi:hypothetical protein